MAENPPSDADKILARGMTPEAYYAKLQRASLFQGALTDAVPSVVEAASLLKEPWELTQAKLDLEKSKATEKGIPLSIQNERIDAAVGKTKQTVDQQLRAISNQLAMNPSPAQRRQLLAQQRRLAAIPAQTAAQASAQVAAQSADVAKQQLAQQQQLEQKIAKTESDRDKQKTGAFLKSFMSASNIWAATRAPADFGTHLLEQQTKFEGKAGKAEEKLEKIEAGRAKLEAEESAAKKALDAPIYEYSTPKPGDSPSYFKPEEAEAKTLERYKAWTAAGSPGVSPADTGSKGLALSEGELEKFQARQASESKLADIQAKITDYNQRTASKIAKLEEQRAGAKKQAGVAQAALGQYQANPPTMGMMPFTPGGMFGVQPQVGMPGYPYLQPSVPPGFKLVPEEEK